VEVASASDDGKFPESTQRLMEFAFKGKEPAMPHFVKWLKQAGAADYTDVAAVGGADKYEVTVIDVMISENIEGSKNLGNKAALRKFYIACVD